MVVGVPESRKQPPELGYPVTNETQAETNKRMEGVFERIAREIPRLFHIPYRNDFQEKLALWIEILAKIQHRIEYVNKGGRRTRSKVRNLRNEYASMEQLEDHVSACLGTHGHDTDRIGTGDLEWCEIAELILQLACGRGRSPSA